MTLNSPMTVQHRTNSFFKKNVKVDNWGIFLLDRLQSCFQRKELCDLTVRREYFFINGGKLSTIKS